MKRAALLLSGALVAAAFGALPAGAQSGFALKGSAVFNHSDVDTDDPDLEVSDAVGFNLGVEYVLPGGLGVGISGYTVGTPDEFEVSEGDFVTLAEANYFLNLPVLPVSPYAGLHVGLGTYGADEVADQVRPEVDFGDWGYQLGVRFQPTALFGLDAQYRHVSGSLSGEQDASFERNQVLLGVTLF